VKGSYGGEVKLKYTNALQNKRKLTEKTKKNMKGRHWQLEAGKPKSGPRQQADRDTRSRTSASA
jgi:hypothetical protein